MFRFHIFIYKIKYLFVVKLLERFIRCIIFYSVSGIRYITRGRIDFRVGLGIRRNKKGAFDGIPPTEQNPSSTVLLEKKGKIIDHNAPIAHAPLAAYS